jgi:hypothetical protein
MISEPQQWTVTMELSEKPSESGHVFEDHLVIERLITTAMKASGLDMYGISVVEVKAERSHD